MPVLSNPRQERFAQALSFGDSATKAYAAAGYQGDRRNASRLATSGDIRARVTELQSIAADRSGITVASITESLLQIADEAERLGDAPGLSVARAALMDAARLNGLVIERTKADVTVSVAHALSDDDLVRIASGPDA